MNSPPQVQSPRPSSMLARLAFVAGAARPMTPFAFASYNAGAGRISQLRKEAARRGLNPNVWFHNVEYIAAEKIGAETVTYVANIYKYYIAYTLIMEAMTEKEKAMEKIKGNSP